MYEFRWLSCFIYLVLVWSLPGQSEGILCHRLPDCLGCKVTTCLGLCKQGPAGIMVPMIATATCRKNVLRAVIGIVIGLFSIIHFVTMAIIITVILLTRIAFISANTIEICAILSALRIITQLRIMSGVAMLFKSQKLRHWRPYSRGTYLLRSRCSYVCRRYTVKL